MSCARSVGLSNHGGFGRGGFGELDEAGSWFRPPSTLHFAVAISPPAGGSEMLSVRVGRFDFGSKSTLDAEGPHEGDRVCEANECAGDEPKGAESTNARTH